MIKAIYTDFFDTLIFRHVHPLQVIKRWAELVSIKIQRPDLYKTILDARFSLNFENSKNIYEYIYYYIIKNEINISFDDFEKLCFNIECAVEIGCQFVNNKHLKWLIKQKNKGYKIYIVSDFYLGKEAFRRFLRAKNISDNLFDDIFISCEQGLCKKNGLLYDKVTELTGISPKNVLMVGDNLKSDYLMARKKNFKTKFIPNFYQHLNNKIKNKIDYNYSKRAFKIIKKDCYKNGAPFCEYALIYFLAIRELYDDLKRRNLQSITFLSREGHFLKRVFKRYQDICIPFNEIINSNYLKISRRASRTLNEEYVKMLNEQILSIKDYLKSLGFSIQEIESMKNKFNLKDSVNVNIPLKENEEYLELMKNEEFNFLVDKKIKNSKKSFLIYVSNFYENKQLNVMDIGWAGSMQEYICTKANIEKFGYYIGLNNTPYSLSNRKGLIFTFCPKQNIISKYGYIFRANIQLYELLASAPHGSILGYDFKDDGETPLIHEDWAKNEKELYINQISYTQSIMTLLIDGISAWCYKTDYQVALKQCANIVLKSAIISNDERLKYVENLDRGFFDNFGKESAGIKYEKKGVIIGLDILYAPEKYTRYLAKLERYLKSKNLILSKIYKPFSFIIYYYIWILTQLKNSK